MESPTGSQQPHIFLPSAPLKLLPQPLPAALIPPSHGRDGLFPSKLSADTRRHLKFNILGLCDESDSAMAAKLPEAEQILLRAREAGALLSTVQLTQPQGGTGTRAGK